MPLDLSVAKLTDTGRTRDHQEDLADYYIPEDDQIRLRKGALYVVADGMGGHNAGEVASRGAVERIIHDYYDSPSSDDVPTSLVQAIKNANRMIYQQAQASPAQSGMGTTAVAVVIRGRELHIANVGDSRAYLIRNGQIRQITVDHSWVEEQVQAGVLTRDQAQTHPQRNVITRALGSKPNVEVDTFQGELREDDVLVLCSDGLTTHVADAEILSVTSQLPPEEATQRLVHRANELGGSDNISVVVIKALPEGAAQQLAARPAQVTPTATPPAQVAPTVVAPPLRHPLIIPIGVGALGLVVLIAVVAVLWLRRGGWPSPKVTMVVSSPPPTTGAVVVTETESPTPQPTDTLQPGAPTSTLAPTPTPAPPTPTWTATPVSTPTNTATPQPTLLAAKLAAPTLSEPQDNLTAEGSVIYPTFKWQWRVRPLEDDEWFELRVWKEGEAELALQTLKEYEWEQRTPPAGFGLYQWRVVVVLKQGGRDGSTLREVSEPSETRLINWVEEQPPEEEEGGGGSEEAPKED